MSDDLSNPHDSFFRGAFALPEVSNPFFQRCLPPGVLVKFDLDTLKLEPGSFIDERLREQRSDLLFSGQHPTRKPGAGVSAVGTQELSGPLDCFPGVELRGTYPHPPRQG
jgi:hypothetical protein